jgi:predicted nucleic acid-binding protein
LIAFDTNILIYAETPDASDQRSIKSRILLERATLHDAVIPLQVFAELSNVCNRKRILEPLQLASRIAEYEEFYETPACDLSDILMATSISKQFNLQYFDALIIAVSARAGAVILLSEDMHDGLDVGGLRIINPFAAANEAFLVDYFDSLL